MKYTVEQLVEALPTGIPYRGSEHLAGLSLYYSDVNKWWKASYGRNNTKHSYCGKTPQEALYFLYKQMIKNKNHKHEVKELN